MARTKDLSLNRGRPVNFRLRMEAQQRFDELYQARRKAGLNYNKSDIMSEAMDLLYEKEKNFIKKELHEPQK